MQEFRPAAVIAADTELAQRLEAGDAAAVRALVARYGAAVVASSIPAVGRRAAFDVATEVFVAAAAQPLRPGDDFAPWLAGLVEDRVGAVDEQRWELAMAIEAIEPSARQRLREHHLGGKSEFDDDLTRHELRLQRRLSHVEDPDGLLAALSEPDVWIDLDPEFVDRVVGEVVGEVVGRPESDADLGDVEPVAVSRVTRGLRPVLFGLAGAVTVLFVAIIGLSAASGNPAQPDYTVELIPTGELLEVTGGEITVTERDAGVQIELDAVTLPRRAGGLYYEGRIVIVDGKEISAGTFSEGDGVTLWAAVGLDEAAVFRITIGDLASDAVDDVVLKADLPRP